MIKRTKLWTNISAITLVGASAVILSACDTQAPESKQSLVKGQNSAEPILHSMIEGEGEGEGANVDLASNDIAYLTQLGLMRGHLFVGHELYKAGHVGHAKTHMKHPQSELYANIKPAFSLRGARGFAVELSNLSDAVEGELGNKAVTIAYVKLIAAIAESELAVKKQSLAPAKKMKLVSELLRVAGEEYAIAVVDGEMQNAHEYQDALGFTTIAIAIVSGISDSEASVKQAKEEALKQLALLKPYWPSLIPPETLSTSASGIYVAAAKIELAGLGIN